MVIRMPLDHKQFIEWFRSASPYIHVHRRKTFVVQFDDYAIHSDTFNNLIHDLALLNSLGIRLVIVYGSRKTIEARLQEKKLGSEFHHGIRITDSKVLEYVKEAAGKLRVDIEARLSMGLGNTPMSNANLRVSSGNSVTAKPKGVVDGIDYQFTGDVRSIDVDSINSNLDAHEIILIPPIGYSTTGETFNLDAYALAARLAIELQADKLIYLIEAEGLSDKNNEIMRQISGDEAASLLLITDSQADNYRYLESTVNACKAGVERVHFIDHRLDGAILQELFTRDGAGTMISTVPYDVVRKTGVEDIPGLLDLIEPLEKQGVLVARSREKLELEIEHFSVMERDGVVIACAALYPFSEDSAELACLVVDPEYCNGGRGKQLLSLLESEAREKGIRNLFVLTTHTDHWFLEQGFSSSSMDELPVEKKDLYNYQRNSKVLIKEI